MQIFSLQITHNKALPALFIVYRIENKDQHVQYKQFHLILFIKADIGSNIEKNNEKNMVLI